MSDEKTLIAQIGRTVGLWGELKFHIYSDFPEQFKIGDTYKSTCGELTILDINLDRGTVKFRGYEDIDAAKKLTNAKIYADEKETKERCKLKAGEYFWFDIIGCDIKEKDEIIGKVRDIHRMADVDYLYVVTQKLLVQGGLPKFFLLPYIDRYILNVDIDDKIIYTQDAKEILEAS